MWKEDSIEGIGEIFQELSERTWMARMKNGYEVLVFRYVEDPSPQVGEKVLLHFNPYDMSRGRIVEINSR